VLFALLLPLAACGGSKSAADGPSDESDASTETTAPADPWRTVVATAAVPEVHVYENPPDTSVTATDAAFAVGELPAIPRKELNSAGMAKTDDGYTYENPTYFENPLVFVVTEDDGEWLKVLLQARPNHTEGWIKRSDVTLSETRTHIELTKSTFHLKAWDGDRLVAETDVVTGKDSTFTPVGTFYIAEKIEKSAGGAYGPWILALNGYSESLDSFDGGMPQLAFHGTNKPELIGTQASNGCVRMPDEVDQLLADQMPVGTPITIVA
jgi:lipoprotein-anchoring transpeptidase ErfK/SrfK